MGKKTKYNVEMWRVDTTLDIEIESFHVVKKTKNNVFIECTDGINGDHIWKTPICGFYSCWFDTWKEAHRYAIEEAERRVVIASSDLIRYKEELEEIKSLEQEEDK